MWDKRWTKLILSVFGSVFPMKNRVLPLITCIIKLLYDLKSPGVYGHSQLLYNM